MFSVKFPHSPLLHYAFSSRIEKTMTKTIHCHWENRFVLQWYGAVRKCYHVFLLTKIFKERKKKIWGLLGTVTLREGAGDREKFSSYQIFHDSLQLWSFTHNAQHKSMRYKLECTLTHIRNSIKYPPGSPSQRLLLTTTKIEKSRQFPCFIN